MINYKYFSIKMKIEMWPFIDEKINTFTLELTFLDLWQVSDNDQFIIFFS